MKRILKITGLTIVIVIGSIGLIFGTMTALKSYDQYSKDKKERQKIEEKQRAENAAREKARIREVAQLESHPKTDTRSQQILLDAQMRADIERIEKNRKDYELNKKQTNEVFLNAFFSIIALAVYFIPSSVAYNRKPRHNNFTSILMLNIFAGWTGAGWIACLVWANINGPKKS